MTETVLARMLSALQGGPIHLTLIDPDKTRGETAARVARDAEFHGSFAVLLGGSTGITPQVVGEVASIVHRASHLPVIIFPQGAESLSGEADAILFMSLMNSRDLGLVVRQQAKASRAVRALDLEPLSTGYIIVAPGMKVGEVGKADCIPRDEPKSALEYALAAQYFGMQLVYLEAGSGAPAPVPAAMIRTVKEGIKIPLIVGGGIRTTEDARAVLEAGADILVTGTVVEEDGASALAPILDEVRRHRGR